VIDGATNAVVRTIQVGVEPVALTCNPAQNRVYAANYYGSSISVLRDTLTGVEECAASGVAAKALTVSSNPIRGTASVRFHLAEQSRVRLSIRDVTGRTVAVLVDGVMKPGVYDRNWQAGPAIPAGIYFLDLETAGRSEILKLALAK